jgi:hypothetical protein
MAGRHAFRPQSVVNISGMSYGSLSRPAVEALNRGAAAAPCMHNTGEGGLADAHKHGANLTFQIGTGYFGCRGEDGRFSLERLQERIAEAPVRAIEIKLSQGAKPGLGGMLPAAKVTPEIAAIRGVPAGKDCVSPSRHSAFGDVDELIAFVERIADATGAAGRREVGGGRPGVLGRAGVAHGRDRRRPGLHHHRRRGGRHRRRPAGVQRPRRAAVEDRVLARLRELHARRHRRRRRLRRAAAGSACPTARSSPSRWAAT